jgi:hypothetical protein
MTAYVGEEFESQALTTPAAAIAKIAYKKKGPAIDDYRHFPLPAGMLLPDWLKYSVERNTVYSVGKIPPNPKGIDYNDDWLIVVKDKIGKIVEQHRFIRKTGPSPQSREESSREFTRADDLRPSTSHDRTLVQLARDTGEEQGVEMTSEQKLEVLNVFTLTHL